ncbi:hypothetical protein H4W30_001357 [Amycolatopsis roodepoortensis]|uniref:Mutator family transposase n=1 Tax=Amycolatopsis roodepoortensis TaxID=700274 RepID=A0ABR9L158_9PSEU|nr:hypothetical protein [Amycolatopsis roodepoortensis]
MLTELKNRGVADVLIVACDGLAGLSDAITTVWPQTITQTCVVHLLRNSFRFAGRRHWDAIVKALKPVYTAPTARERSPSSPTPGAHGIRPSCGCGTTSGPSSYRSSPSIRRSGG